MPHDRPDGRLPVLEKHRTATQFQPLDPAGAPSVVLQTRVTAPVLERLDAAVDATGLSRSEALREALVQWLERRERH